MTRRALRITAEAAADIDSILDFTLARFGTAQYAAYRALMSDALESLREDPMHPGTKLRAGLGKDVRTLHVGLAAQRRSAASHVIAYAINNDGGLTIVRVLHESMDLTRHLPPMIDGTK